MALLRPVVSAPLAGCCTVLSVFGVIILTAVRIRPPFPPAFHRLTSHARTQRQFGLAFSYRTEAMTGSTHDPKDPSAVARVCYLSAAVYVGFMVFCGCQLMTHKRYPRGVQL